MSDTIEANKTSDINEINHKKYKKYKACTLYIDIILLAATCFISTYSLNLECSINNTSQCSYVSSVIIYVISTIFAFGSLSMIYKVDMKSYIFIMIFASIYINLSIIIINMNRYYITLFCIIINAIMLMIIRLKFIEYK